MAKLRLKKRDTKAARLPPVCMVCGNECTKARKTTFSWTPMWVHVLILAGLLPYVIIHSILTKRMSVEVPLCTSDRRYFGMRTLMSFLTIFGAIGLGGLIFVAIIALAGDPGEAGAGLICGFPLLVLAVAIITMIAIRFTMIRAVQITDDEITLTWVHEGFVEAVDEMREQRNRARRQEIEEDEFDADPPPRRRPEPGTSRPDDTRYRSRPSSRRQERDEEE